MDIVLSFHYTCAMPGFVRAGLLPLSCYGGNYTTTKI